MNSIELSLKGSRGSKGHCQLHKAFAKLQMMMRCCSSDRKLHVTVSIINTVHWQRCAYCSSTHAVPWLPRSSFQDMRTLRLSFKRDSRAATLVLLAHYAKEQATSIRVHAWRE
eukprot:7354-Heterococcus_DN1.PRE.5